MLKILYGMSLGLMGFVMTFIAPSGKLMTTPAEPDRVQRDTQGASTHGSSRARSSRGTFIFVSGGGYGK